MVGLHDTSQLLVSKYFEFCSSASSSSSTALSPKILARESGLAFSISGKPFDSSKLEKNSTMRLLVALLLIATAASAAPAVDASQKKAARKKKATKEPERQSARARKSIAKPEEKGAPMKTAA